MPAPRIDRWSALIIVSLGLLLAAACTQIAPTMVPAPLRVILTQPVAEDRGVSSPVSQSSAENVAAPVATATARPVQPGRAVPPTPITTPSNSLPTVTVQRGTITQTLQLNGRVSGTDETTVAFSGHAVPVRVNVKPGDLVEASQVLVEGDAKDVQQSLRSAQDQLDAASVRLDQAQKSAQARQQAAGTNQQDAISAAEDGLRQAFADQAKVQAGASDQDKQAADAAVLTARADLARAQSQFDNLTRSASPADVQAAQDAVANAQLVVRQAQADAARMAAGPDPVEVRTAEREVADAQTNLAAAQSALDGLTGGPDPYAMRTAQRNVDRAQSALNAANAVTVGGNSGTSQAAKDAAVVQAKTALADAQDQLAKLKEPPSQQAVAAAHTRLDDAKATLANAQAKLDSLRAGTSQLALDKANAAVASAQLTLQGAQAKLDQLQTGPSDDQVQAAQSAVDAAQLQLTSAQNRRDAVYAHPTKDELDTAQQRVDTARRALDRARAADLPQEDQTLAEMEVQRLRQQVAQLQSELEATRLRAPAAGQVVSVLAQPGEALEGGSPAVVLAGRGDPIVRITLPGDDLANAPATTPTRSMPPITPGQSASVRIDGGPATPFVGSISDVVDGPSPNTRTALVKVQWGSAHPVYGVTASVQIDVQSKPGALIVPSSAVKSAGSQKYVEFLDGTSRRAQPVTVGITSESSVEILSGLSEGQVILAGTDPVPAATAAATAVSGPAEGTLGPSAPSASSPGANSGGVPAITPALAGPDQATPSPTR